MARLFGASLVLVAACGFDPSGDGGDPDARTDAAVVDGDTTDGADPDGTEIDAAQIDAAQIDAAQVDAAQVDAAVIDAAVIDAAMIDAAVDAVPTDAAVDAVACPVGYGVTSGTSRYRYVATTATFATATADCADDLPGRTHLATFETAADLDPTADLLAPLTATNVWIGATCTPAGSAPCNLRASWVWITGGAVAESLWQTGQPSATDQLGGAIRQVATVWRLNDQAVTESPPYICECDP